MQPSGSGSPVKEFGDFHLLRKLGAGGMGSVHLAHQVSMDRQVALKILAPDLANRAEFVERFYAEARASAKLRHPNIVQGYAVGSHSGVHYFVMEFIEGEGLDRKLSRGPLPVEEALRYTLDVAEALAHAHSHGLIHRDIKPSNILIAKDGTARVVDLGLTKRIGDDRGLTQAGVVMGTLPYMPPEQAGNANLADARSDIYALGVTLYHLLTGKKPFTGSTATEIITAKLLGTYVPLRDYNENVSSQIESIVARMVQPTPEDRYQRASEVIAAIRPLLDATGRPSSASRRRVGVAFVTATAGIIAAILYFNLLDDHPTGQKSNPTVRTPDAVSQAPDSAWQMNSYSLLPPSNEGEKALAEVVSGASGAARERLARALGEQPASSEIRGLLNEVESGVLITYQYRQDSLEYPHRLVGLIEPTTLMRPDQYRFAIAPTQPCFVYAFRRDDRPSVSLIFPNAEYSPETNPLAPGRVHWLPEERGKTASSWMDPDSHDGVGRIYFLAVKEPLDDGQLAHSLLTEPGRFRHPRLNDLAAFSLGSQTPLQSCFADRQRVMAVLELDNR